MERVGITTDSMEYESAVRDCYEHLYASKLNNPINSVKNTSTKLSQEVIENVNSPISIKI